MTAIRLYALFCFFVISGLSFTGTIAHADQRPQLSASIQADIADLSCDKDDDCSFIPYGSRPCGGPWNYKLFSRKTTDERALWAKVEKYNKMDEYYNQKSDLQSECRFIVPPQTSCVNGMCNGSASHSTPY